MLIVEPEAYFGRSCNHQGPIPNGAIITSLRMKAITIRVSGCKYFCFRLAVLSDHLHLRLGDVPVHVLCLLLAGGAPRHEQDGQHGHVAADPGHGDRGQRGE